VQRATAQLKTGNFRDYGVAEAPPGFQAGWSDCIHLYFFSLSVHFFCSSVVTDRESAQNYQIYDEFIDVNHFNKMMMGRMQSTSTTL
jgi:hypothetical protein